MPPRWAPLGSLREKIRRGTESFQRELRYEQRQVARPEQERRRLASLYQFDSKACSWCGLLVQSNRIIFGERRQFFHGLAPLVSAKRYPSAMPDNRIIPLQRHLVPGGPSQLRARYPPIWATSVMASLNRSGCWSSFFLREAAVPVELPGPSLHSSRKKRRRAARELHGPARPSTGCARPERHL